jgi:hypothetical protein
VKKSKCRPIRSPRRTLSDIGVRRLRSSGGPQLSSLCSSHTGGRTGCPSAGGSPPVARSHNARRCSSAFAACESGVTSFPTASPLPATRSATASDAIAQPGLTVDRGVVLRNLTVAPWMIMLNPKGAYPVLTSRFWLLPGIFSIDVPTKTTGVEQVRRFEAPKFEPAQCYQLATSHQRNSSETGRTSTGQNAQALE